jgi:hypothetical protein
VWGDVNAVLSMLGKRAKIDAPLHVNPDNLGTYATSKKKGIKYVFEPALRQQLTEFFLPW